ncbi:MAG: hypothetical protein KKE84_01860 [Gammaproteobacteria bacterium]|nr:hypothetical protein [Gammaproteobacteria bacterium]
MKRQNLFLIVLILMSGAPAWADQGADPFVSDVSEQAVSMFGSAAIADEQLDQLRGRLTVFNSNEVDGQLYNNEAVSNVTGSNFVTDGSFAGMSGFSTVIQNSGNNVLIQNATVLNLQFQ